MDKSRYNKPELPIPPTNLSYYTWGHGLKFETKPFLELIKSEISRILNKVEKFSNEYHREMDIFSKNINNIITLRNQQKTKTHNSIMFIVTFAVFAFTGIIVGINLIEFNTENFDPIFTNNNPDILVKDSLRPPQYEYRIPLEISSMTSNHYKISVWAISESLELYNLGPCFIKEISLDRPETSVVYLQADGDEISLEPRFDLIFEDTLPYFSPKEMERTVLHSIGRMEFVILAEDIQDKNNFKRWNVRADLTMLAPGNLYFDAGEHCEKVDLLIE